MKVTYDEDVAMRARVAKLLEDSGWKLYRGDQDTWFKRLPNSTRCLFNDQEGIQVGLSATTHTDIESVWTNYELSIRGQKQDGIWCDLKVYGLSHADIATKLEQQCNQLIAAWELVANYK